MENFINMSDEEILNLDEEKNPEDLKSFIKEVIEDELGEENAEEISDNWSRKI